METSTSRHTWGLILMMSSDWVMMCIKYVKPCVGKCTRSYCELDTRPRQDEGTIELDYSDDPLIPEQWKKLDNKYKKWSEIEHKPMPENKCSFCPSHRGHNGREQEARELESKRRQESTCLLCTNYAAKLSSGQGQPWVTFTTPYTCTQLDIIIEDKCEDTRCTDCGDTYCWGGARCSARDTRNVVTRWVGNMWAKVREMWDTCSCCLGLRCVK
jgi:hypothetical protein